MVLTQRDPLPRLAGSVNKGKLLPTTELQALIVLGGLGSVGDVDPWESAKMQILIGRSGWNTKQGLSSKFPGQPHLVEHSVEHSIRGHKFYVGCAHVCSCPELREDGSQVQGSPYQRTGSVRHSPQCVLRAQDVTYPLVMGPALFG